MSTIGFIGGGNMAEALIKGVIESGVYKPENIIVSDIRVERLNYIAEKYNITITEDNGELAEKADLIVLSVKPQNMSEVLEEIKGNVNKETLVISIAAGVRTQKIANLLGEMAIVRVMPNTPALIGKGTSALFANTKGQSRLDEAEKIFSAVGSCFFVADEGLMDAVTAVSGSGPAYYFLLTEEMIKAAVELGFDDETAKKLVLQTALGAASLAVEADKDGQSPADLREKVTSVGGTTEAALKVFKEAGFETIVADAVKRARDRSRELSG